MMMIHEGCAFCLHFQKVDDRDPKFFCDAFPNGIPDEIVRMRFDHRKPHPDDNGIQFEMNPQFEHLREGVEEAYAHIEGNIQTLTEVKQEREARLRKTYGLEEDADLDALKEELDKMLTQRIAKIRKKRKDKQ